MSGAPLALVGNLNLDLWISPVARFPRPDEEIVTESARLELAGTAGYALQAALALGIEPRVISTIGDDAFGRVVLQEMARLGAPTTGVEVRAGEETALGTVFVAPDGSRGILSTLGAHRAMDAAVAERYDAFIGPSAEVLICGNYLLPRFSPEDALPYAARRRGQGQVVVFDPSWDPDGWREPTRRSTLRLLREVDVYLPNEAEILHLTGRRSLREAITDVAAIVGEVVVKRGASGAVYARGEERVAAASLPVRAVNTIGAGDVFDIGYLFARRRGDAPADRLRFAGALAGAVVRQPGRRLYPGVDEAESALREGGNEEGGEPA